MKFSISSFNCSDVNTNVFVGYNKLEKLVAITTHNIDSMVELEQFLSSYAFYGCSYCHRVLGFVDCKGKEEDYISYDVTVTGFTNLSEICNKVLSTLDKSKFSLEENYLLVMSYIWCGKYDKAYKLLESLDDNNVKENFGKLLYYEFTECYFVDSDNLSAIENFLLYGDDLYSDSFNDVSVYDFYYSFCKNLWNEEHKEG